MLKMIIVDDEPDMLEGIINHMPFAELGIEISAVCENGLDGLNSITQIRPDIILCDISMPKMNGFEMLEKLRSLPDYAPQVIMLTGHDDFKHAKEAIKYQVMDYLVKPVMPADILAAITQAKKCAKVQAQTGKQQLKALRHHL